MKCKIQSLFLAAVVICPPLSGRADTAGDIVEEITSDSINVIVVPDALMERLKYHEPQPTSPGKRLPQGMMAGYRVQILSDNNARTAKNEARQRERQVMSRFPQYRTYKKYAAPYWRVRVGDFRTQAQAEEAAAAMRRSFPRFSKEIRVVKDRIYISEQ